MKLLDFSDKDQENINNGLSTAEITDKEAAQKILDLVPDGLIEKIPFFVKSNSTTKTIERIANDLDRVLLGNKPDNLAERERKERRE